MIRRVTAATILSLFGVAYSARADQIYSLAGIVGVASCEGVSAYELWNSTQAQAVSGDAVVLVIRLDPEAGSDDALLLVGQYGTGVEPVCLRFAASSGQVVNVSAGAQSGGFIVGVAEREYLVTVDAGARVLLNDTMVGQIR